MGWNCYFGEIENQIRDACNEYPPNFEKIERLMAQCKDLSIVSKDDPDENILSDIILWYPEPRQLQVYCESCYDSSCEGCSIAGEYDGRYLPQIVKLFLAHGFDAERDGGRVGRMCLCNLTFSSRDIYVIEAEKLLLNAGADPTMRVDGESIIDQYSVEESFRSCEQEHRQANLYHAMRRIAEAASCRKDYNNIEFFEVCLGKRIDKIEMACTGVTPSRAIYNVGFPFPKYKNCFATPIVFHCEGKQLCVNRYVDIFVDPNILKEAETVCNIEPFFPDCVGHRIEKIEFGHTTVWEGTTSYGQPIILIRLDNGKTIRFSINFGEVPREEMTAFFSVV